MERARSNDLSLLLQRALESGGFVAWEEFVYGAHDIVASAVFRTLARWRVPQKEQVEDLVQETFLKLCANNHSLLRRFRSDRPEAIIAYLRAIAGTVVCDAQRSHGALKRGAGSEPLELDETRDAAQTTESLNVIERKILLERVDRCLAGQKDRDRHVFWLHYRQGLTAQAIAAIKVVELTSSGVESLIRRLTIVVRKCLKIQAAGDFSAFGERNARVKSVLHGGFTLVP